MSTTTITVAEPATKTIRDALIIEALALADGGISELHQALDTGSDSALEDALWKLDRLGHLGAALRPLSTYDPRELPNANAESTS